MGRQVGDLSEQRRHSGIELGAKPWKIRRHFSAGHWEWPGLVGGASKRDRGGMVRVKEGESDENGAFGEF